MLVGLIGAAMVGFVIGTWVQSVYEDKLYYEMTDADIHHAITGE